MRLRSSHINGIREKCKTHRPERAGPKCDPRFDVRKLVTTKIDKRGRTLRAFETPTEVLRERDHRISVLEAQGNSRCSRLAEVLAECCEEQPCESSACPCCIRDKRITWSAGVLEFLDPYDVNDVRFITLINSVDAIPVGQLRFFNPRRLIHRTRRQLERAGINKVGAFVIGAVDGEFDAGWEIYQAHLHCVAVGIDDLALAEMTSRWPDSSGRIRIRKRNEPIDDVPRVVAYLLKHYWPSVARKKNPGGLYPHDNRRPPPDIEIEVLLWLHAQELADLQLLYGVKQYGRHLFKT